MIPSTRWSLALNIGNLMEYLEALGNIEGGPEALDALCALVAEQHRVTVNAAEARGEKAPDEELLCVLTCIADASAEIARKLGRARLSHDRRVGCKPKLVSDMPPNAAE